jgi:hypothetical protein
MGLVLTGKFDVPLKIRSKNGMSIPSDTMEKNMESKTKKQYQAISPL